MTKKRNRLIAITLIAVMLIISAVGCSGGNKKENESSILKLTDSKDLKEATLTFYFPGAENANTQNVLKEIEKRVHNQLNINLKFVWINDYNPINYVSEICYNKDKVFDGFYMKEYGDDWDLKFTELAKKGQLKDLSGLLQKYAPNVYCNLAPEQLKSVTYGGKLFAIPNPFPYASFVYAVVREDFMKKYNIPDIKTREDYEVYLKTVKEKEKDITVPGMIGRWDSSMSLFANANDYSILDQKQQLVYKRNDPEMKIMAWEQTPEFIKISNDLISWKKKGYMEWGDSMTNPQEKLQSGYTASILGSFSGPYFGPGYKAYKLYPDKKTDRSISPTGSFAFNANSPNVERALMFINWIESSRENYNLFMYGIEGIDYTLKGEKKQVIPQSDYYQWQGKDAFTNIKYMGESDYTQFIENSIVYPPHTGFYPDNSELSLETGDRLTVLNLMNQNITNGLMLKEDIDSDLLKAYNDGTDNLINNMQIQLNKWK